jgi:hypothetical protein
MPKSSEGGKVSHDKMTTVERGALERKNKTLKVLHMLSPVHITGSSECVWRQLL